MIAIAHIIARLADLAPSLAPAEPVADLDTLMTAKVQPQGKPLAHVMTMGLRGGEVQYQTGGFIQGVEVTFAVILTIPTRNDAKGARVSADVLGLQLEVAGALCGWGPDDAPGQVRMTRAFIASLRPGALVTIIEFAIGDQLRIIQ